MGSEYSTASVLASCRSMLRTIDSDFNLVARACHVLPFEVKTTWTNRVLPVGMLYLSSVERDNEVRD